jgi:membrane associated rhomboid family serine protease
MDGNDLAGKRLMVGLFALACLAASALIWVFNDQPKESPVLGATTRVGLVMGALWLAMPRRGESVAWRRALPVLAALVLALAFLKRAFVYVVPMAAVLAVVAVLVRPRPPRRR